MRSSREIKLKWLQKSRLKSNVLIELNTNWSSFAISVKVAGIVSSNCRGLQRRVFLSEAATHQPWARFRHTRSYQLLCNCSSFKHICPLVAWIAAPTVFAQCSCHHCFVSVSQSLHYKCDMLAYTDTQHSLWSANAVHRCTSYCCSWLNPVHHRDWTFFCNQDSRPLMSL